MKVLIITYLYDHIEGGGAAKSARVIANGLAGQGHEVAVFTSCKKSESGTVDFINGIKVYRFFPPNLYWVADKDIHPTWKKVLWQLIDIWNPLIYNELKKVLAIEKPDVVHVQKMRGFSSAIWSGLAKFGVTNIIQTCRDYEAISPEGTLDSLVGKLAKDGSPLMRPYQFLRAVASRHVKVVTAPSQATIDIISSRHLFPSAKRYVVPNSHGYSLAELSNLYCNCHGNRRQSLSNDINLLYIGRLEENKGINLLCDIFNELSKKYKQFKLHIAGFGTQDAHLRHKFSNHPSIIFHGSVYNDNKTQMYLDSDIVIVPSIWPEVFGNVIVEAFAHGKPVIGTSVGGIPEIINTGSDGWVVPTLDQASVEKILLQYLDMSDVEKNTLKKNCFNRAKSFATEHTLNNYLNIYKELLLVVNE